MKSKVLAILFAVAKLQSLEVEMIDSPHWNYKIEIGIERPSIEQAPLLIFLHGASGRGLKGIDPSLFDHWVKKGYAVASISMPGYGESTGKRDFCGPFTMKFLNFAIDHIKERLDASSFGIIGFGQGAIASVLLASQRTDIRCVVCSNGGYDLVRHKVHGDTLMEVLEKNGYDLNVHDKKALLARSPLAHIATIDAPLYLVHRKKNPVITEEEVIYFHDAMTAAQKECYLTLFEKTAESDPQKLEDEEVLEATEGWVDLLMSEE